jgi:hypothetical protein
VVAGAAGRLGEAILAAVLSSSRYRTVSVVTTAPLGSTIAGLKGLSLQELQDAASRHQAAARQGPGAAYRSPELDIFICWGDATDPFGRAYNRRDAVYAEIRSVEQLRQVATAAAGLQARRLLLVAPLLAWHQVSAAGRMLPEAMEMELARLPIPTIVIMRPTSERAAGAATGGSRLERFARFYLSQLRFMLPAVTQTLRSTEIARAALSVVAEAEKPGLIMVPLEEIRHHAGRPRARHGTPWRKP